MPDITTIMQDAERENRRIKGCLAKRYRLQNCECVITESSGRHILSPCDKHENDTGYAIYGQKWIPL